MNTTRRHPPLDPDAGDRSAAGHCQGDYISPKETRALLRASVPARNARLSAADMVSATEAAALAKTSLSNIKAWITQGRCIGLSGGHHGVRLPKWQFDSPIWSLLPALASALGTKDGWALLSFLETPHGALGGVSARQAIEQGQGQQVLDIAGHDEY